MATLRKRGPSQWQVQVRRKGWPLQTKTFNTQAEAKTWATMIEREMDAGVFVSRNEAESTSFANALEIKKENFQIFITQKGEKEQTRKQQRQ